MTTRVKLPPIPEPRMDAASQFETLMALKRAVDIIAADAAGVSDATIFDLGLGTAATRNVGSTAWTVPLLDANGSFLNQITANVGGWGVVTKCVGVPNESGVYFDASNNPELSIRGVAGDLRVRWQGGSPSSHIVDGLPAYVCRAWVIFDGFTTVIRNGGNISSVSKFQTGRYRINFYSPMPNSNYCAIATMDAVAAGTDAKATGHTAWSVDIITVNANSEIDANPISVAIFC